MRKELVMKKLFAVVLVGLTVVVLPFGCNGANEVAGPDLPGTLRPKKVIRDPLDPRTRPVGVSRPRAPVVAPARRADPIPPTPAPTPRRTPRVPPCWKNPANCIGA